MSTPRPGTPGATRVCPHCKETVLESAAVCPACRHHLRYDEQAAAAAAEKLTPLRVEGSIRHPSDAPPCEYSVVVSVRNDRGEEIARKLVSVGAMQPDEMRSFALTVEVTPARGRASGKGGVRH
jgi:uncharacterized protein YbaR (Trm112 family)